MDHDIELAKRNRELSILNTIAQALNREVDLARALNTALAQLADLFGLRTGWIWLLDETGAATLAATLNLPPALVRDPTRMHGSCYCLDTFRAGDMAGAANINVITCTRLKGLVDGTDGLRYHASVPLYDHGRRLGVLNVASVDWQELSPDDLRLLYTVGDLLGIAIERARLFARSAELGALEERNRLAREIHDTQAQGLAAIALQLETADALLEAGAGQDRARVALQRAIELTRHSLDEARRSVYDLRAAPLEGRGLAAALASLVAELDSPIPVDLRVSGPAEMLPPWLTGGLYRIAREALSNALRHSGASQIGLELVVAPGSAQLYVSDDGRGFDPSEAPSGHFGLIGMGERARLLGGSLRIDTAVGGGTVIEVEVSI